MSFVVRIHTKNIMTLVGRRHAGDAASRASIRKDSVIRAGIIVDVDSGMLRDLRS